VTQYAKGKVKDSTSLHGGQIYQKCLTIVSTEWYLLKKVHVYLQFSIKQKRIF